jgi:CheY-like chemotaxis protein
MARLRLLHWKAGEASEIVQTLASAGHTVDYDEQWQPALMKQWRESPPDAFVIDLSRLPSHGREIAIALRQSKKTARIPVIFCGGADEKVAQTRSLLPAETYCAHAQLVPSVLAALAKPIPEKPAKPTAMMDRYAGRTAAQKLGIKEGSTVLLIDPPRDALKALGEVPAGVRFEEDESAGASDVTLCFVHSVDDLQPTLSRIRRLAAVSKLWILWRKKTAPNHAGVTEPLVRETGIQLGLVDYKICSVSAIWSAMAFARKK